MTSDRPVSGRSGLFRDYQYALPMTLHESIGILLIVALAFACAVTRPSIPQYDDHEYRLIWLMP